MEGSKRKMKTRLVDIGTSTDDPPVEQSIVERDGTEEGSKISEGMDARILNLLDRVEEQLGQEDKVTRTVIKTHIEQIKKLTEVIVGHGKRSCAIQKSEQPAVTKSRGRSKKMDTKGEDTLLTRAKGKRHVEVTVKTCKSTNPPLKLDFDDDEDDNCTMEIMQQGHGTPFTYVTNMVMYMESADMPLCLDLLFRPPLGMEFVESELVVAAYIFGNELSEEKSLFQMNIVVGEGEHFIHCSLVKKWWTMSTWMNSASGGGFLPLLRHWYLVVIDLLNGKLVYLISAKVETVTKRKARLDQIRYVVVNNATRMRLDVDLVMGRHNAKRNEVTPIAEED
ncbi:uncharacterized protein DS421_1g11390 [Arachis hypogaea]|nr:uncharacterized protein DS421_1g11390 [Arachis hypogaea]